MLATARVIGVGILGYLAPRVLLGAGVPLDDWANDLGVWLGLSKSWVEEWGLTVIGIFIGIAFSAIEVWLRPVKHIWSKILRREQVEPSTQSPLTPTYDNQQGIRDRFRITELIEYVGLERPPNPPTPLMNTVDDFLTELRQTLRDGEIQAWGKPRKHYPPIYDPHGKPTEEIPGTFWRESCIFALNVFVDWEKISTMPDNALASGASKDGTYTHLELDLSQVKARFAGNAWQPILENFEKYGTRQVPKP